MGLPPITHFKKKIDNEVPFPILNKMGNEGYFIFHFLRKWRTDLGPITHCLIK